MSEIPECDGGCKQAVSVSVIEKCPVRIAAFMPSFEGQFQAPIDLHAQARIQLITPVVGQENRLRRPGIGETPVIARHA
jgi:hypothetical protein